MEWNSVEQLQKTQRRRKNEQRYKKIEKLGHIWRAIEINQRKKRSWDGWKVKGERLLQWSGS